MRTLLVAMVLGPLLAPSRLAAQRVDLEDSPTLHFRTGILTLVSRRNAIFAGRVGKGDGLQPGMDASLWWSSVLGSTDIGVQARLLGGDFAIDSSAEASGSEASGDVANLDLDVHAGRRTLHGKLGFGLRRFTGGFRSVNRSFLRVGARSYLTLGSSREFEVMLSGTLYVGVKGGAGGSGREGETRLIFSPQCSGGGGIASLLCGRTFLVAGYRFEQFTAKAIGEVGGDQPEEIGSLVFGAGIRFPASN